MLVIAQVIFDRGDKVAGTVRGPDAGVGKSMLTVGTRLAPENRTGIMVDRVAR